MSKVLLIARREYVRNFKKRSFLLSAFGMPMFILALWVVIFAVSEQQARATGDLDSIGYVDLAGVVEPGVEAPEGFVAYEDAAAAEAAFENGEIDAYFVITRTYWSDGAVEVYAHAEPPRGVQRQIEQYLRENVALRAPADRVERLQEPGTITMRVIGNPLEITEESALVLFLLPLAFALIFMMATTITSQFLMQGVSEEKENRIMEILVTSASPAQILAGKVLGLGGLGLTQLLFWGLVAGGIVIVSDSPIAQLLRLPPLLIALVLTYFVLGYLFYGAIMAGIGAATAAEQEGRQIASVLSLIIVLPMIFSVTFFQDPNGTVPVLLSLIPFTAPIAMLFRLPIASVPAWQFIVSLGLLALSTALAVWISAKVFRLGMLMYGKRLRLGDIMSVLRPGKGSTAIQTTAVGPQKGRGN